MSNHLEEARLRHADRLPDLDGWRKDLELRIARATQRFNSCDFFSPAFDELLKELHDFQTIAHADKPGGEA